MPGLQERIERSHHVFYEFQMLAETAYRLSFRQSEFDRVTLNAYLESFGIHLRALIDFLYSIPSGHQTDVHAKDFFSVKKRSQWNPTKLVTKADFESDCERVNEEIAHLTSERHINAGDKPWRFWEIYQRIRPLLEEFDRLVDPQYLDQSWDKASFLLSAPRVSSGSLAVPSPASSGVYYQAASSAASEAPSVSPTDTDDVSDV